MYAEFEETITTHPLSRYDLNKCADATIQPIQELLLKSRKEILGKFLGALFIAVSSLLVVPTRAHTHADKGLYSYFGS